MKIKLICLIALFTVPFTLHSEVFKYTDNEGAVHYVDDFKKVPDVYKDNAINPVKLKEITRTPSIKTRNYPTKPTQPMIEIFVTSWCQYCKSLESYLEKNNLSFIRYDIERNKLGAKKYKALGEGSIPVVKIGRSIIKGFVPKEIEAALKRAG